MNNAISSIRNKLEQQKGQHTQLQQNIAKNRLEMRDSSRSLRRHEQAREIVREIGLKTQQQLQFHLSDITSLALEAVFDNPYELVVEFVQRRNKTECDLLFERDGNRVDPIEASGVGAVDIASFALRIASWSMSRPHSRNVIILDEPFKCLSNNYQEKASQMVKELSEKLGLQFIIVTHEPILANYADRVFEVSIKKGRSKVEVI
jgi:DNA repair exonuclease SbcCD ATPase subunit